MASSTWAERFETVAQRYDREYRGETVEVPESVEALPVFQDWVAGSLAARITSPFWEIAQPKKRQTCLDLGCGGSFLFYPWRDWDARFYGQDISPAICQMVNARGSQLNSKLYKGMRQAPAHQLDGYEPGQFDLAIATGVSCYYPWDYWDIVLSAVKKVLKPEGAFVFDVINPEKELAEDWAILEMYLGAEVELMPLADWKKSLKAAGVKVKKEKEGELFHLFKVVF
ncbi:MAG: methyltransferase domain-containing protein [Leptolyngbya sp. SIO1E4]|nr:methyltransferase domain-containing protein [Leptolyngbya sp. SIO1E4]